MAGAAVIPSLATDLRALLGEDAVSDSEAVRFEHGRDESYHPSLPPDLVVFPRSVDDVVATVDRCRASGVPLIPFGTGTAPGPVPAGERVPAPA